MKGNNECTIKNEFKSPITIIPSIGEPIKKGGQGSIIFREEEPVEIWLKVDEGGIEPEEITFKSDSSSKYGPEGDYSLTVTRSRKPHKKDEKGAPMWTIILKSSSTTTPQGVETYQHLNVTVSEPR
jgi:hypothetical protein